MPTGKRDHPTSKSVICFGCGKKDLNLKCLLDNPFLIKLIKEHIDCGFNPELNEHPTAPPAKHIFVQPRFVNSKGTWHFLGLRGEGGYLYSE